MVSKRTSRRELLKGGAVVGGFTVGAVAGGELASRFTLGAVSPALGQTPASGPAPAPGPAPAHEAPMVPASEEADRLRRALSLRDVEAHTGTWAGRHPTTLGWSST